MVTLPSAPGEVMNLLTAVAMLALAGWLLWLQSHSRVHRALALFLVVRGLLNAAAAVVAQPEAPVWLLRVDALSDFGVLFTGLYFVVAYRDPRGHRPTSRRATVGLATGYVVVAASYLASPGLWQADGEAGPLFALRGLRYFSYAAVAWVLAVDASRATEASRRAGLLLVSAGFGLNALYQGLIHLFLYEMAGFVQPLPDFALLAGGPYVELDHWLRVAALVPMAAAAITIIRRAGGTDAPLDRRETRAYLVALVLAALSTAVHVNAIAMGLVTTEGARVLGTMIDAFWAIANPILLTAALLRHGLFDVQVKVKRTIQQSTVAAAFVAAFFVTSEGAAAFLGDRTGNSLLGILAAGALVFALAPLQRFAHGVADTAMPGIRSVDEMSLEERTQVYREQATVAWKDGVVDRNERAMLDRLRETLQLPAETAVALESEAARDG